MRGVGGPLLTVSDLLSDLAVDGGDDHIDVGGDASVPSSPLAAQQVEEAEPSDLQRLFESSNSVFRTNKSTNRPYKAVLFTNSMWCATLLLLFLAISAQIQKCKFICAFIINQEDYDNLMKSLQENDPSWPSLMLKLCRALKTSDKLLSCANTKAQQLLEKVEALEHVLERGDHAVAAIVEGL